MNTPPPVPPRRRLQELLAIPDGQRTEAEWDELHELEISLAPGNRLDGKPYRQDAPPKQQQQRQQRHAAPKPPKPAGDAGGNSPGPSPGSGGGGGGGESKRGFRRRRPKGPKPAEPGAQ